MEFLITQCWLEAWEGNGWETDGWMKRKNWAARFAERWDKTDWKKNGGMFLSRRPACVKNCWLHFRAGLIRFACLCARACLSDDINIFGDNGVQRSRFCWSPIWPLKRLLSVSNTQQQLLALFLFNLCFRKGTRGHCKLPLHLSPFNYANGIHYHRLKCCGGC